MIFGRSLIDNACTFILLHNETKKMKIVTTTFIFILYFFSFSATRSKSSYTAVGITFAYLCVCLIFVCPTIFETCSSGTPFDSIHVANVCRAR